MSKNDAENILGINRRNLEYIYPYNPRLYFNLANDKVQMKTFLNSANIPIPSSYVIISRMGMINSIYQKIQELENFVVKPSKGKMGNGILVLKKIKDLLWQTPSGKLYSVKNINKHIGDILFGIFANGLHDKAIIEYKVNLHPSLASLYDKGVSDIRIILFKENIIMSMARIPTNQSNGRANMHQGAIGVGIDIQQGKFKQGFDKNRYLDFHPDTGTKLVDFPIPFWSKILSISRQIGKIIPLKYLGVDIVIDADLGPLVLEINARPGLEIQNVNKIGLRKILKEYQ